MESAHTAVLELSELRIEGGKHYCIEDVANLPYHHIEYMGHGRTAVVDKVRHTRTNSIYARKTVRFSPGKLQRVREEYRQEVQITRRLAQHHHIVRVVASYHTRDSLALILEPAADGGDLKTFLANFVAGKDPTARECMEAVIRRAYGCLAGGLSFMHQHRIRHRDIKPENILLHSGSVLYADFGVARDYSDRAHSATEDHPGAYTPRYCAPEVFAWERRTWRSDVFSLGCVFLLLYTAMYPNEIIGIVARGRFYEYVREVRDALEGFEEEGEVVECMKRMVRLEEEERASAAEVVGILREWESRYFCGRCREELLGSPDRLGDSIESLSTTSSAMTLCHEETSSTGLSDLKHCDDRGAWNNRDMVRKLDLNGQLKTTNRKSLRVDENSGINTQTMVPYIPNRITSQSDLKPFHGRHDSLTSAAGQDISPFTSAQERPTSTLFTYTNQSIQVLSSLAKYGIHKQKIVRTLRTITATNQKRSSHAGEPEEHILSEDHTYDWVLRYLGIGFRLSKRKPYGSILPSLSTYPVVECWDYEWDLLRDGSVLDIQRAFAERKIHPYVQDESGRNLLYLAILFHRLDICTLLHAYGVAPTPTHKGRSLILNAMANSHNHPPSTAISTLRFLLSSLGQTPDFDSPVFIQGRNKFFWDEEVMEWLFTCGPEYGLDMRDVSELCLRNALRKAQVYLPRRRKEVEERIERYLTGDMLGRIKRGEVVLLGDLFVGMLESERISDAAIWGSGSLWLSILSRHGIDIAAYLLHELSAHPGHMLPGQMYDRKILAGYSEERGYSLGWRYAFEHMPGHLVVTEFRGLGLVRYDGEWPFAEWELGEEDWDVKRVWEIEQRRRERFERRMGKRARKDVRLLGNGWGESKIPGSWID